ncbi:hypothetical protein E2493_08820 [Sphingomonas parva]|uniref:Uncharacterized protein n=1 Tax=Sphingomonas parva TaxID=2555898 RepID=A0A4Y8ZRS0_9SPHN|nr:hypothetical protein [Sphingomonas parva]TFI58721.1 hypothetical protein E2493_08820 [Sphingomonas parva]
MTEAYHDALNEQAKQSIWATLRQEAANLPAAEKASLIADVAGIFDPTPISDGVGGVLSLIQGDFLGAGLSVVGMVPYVGDLGKIAKIGKRAPRTAAILKNLLTKGDNAARAGEAFLKNNFTLQQIKAAREQATKRVREALLKARNKLPCKDCAKLKNQGKKQLQMPSGTGSGKWKTPDGRPPRSGNGTYEFDTPVELPDGRKVSSVEYRDGFPNFDSYTKDGKHTLWEVSGDADTDAARLTRQMRETNPGYKPPDPNQYVLHHFEDGQVGYVPRKIHDRAEGGAAHSGGNTIVNNDLF